MRTLVLFGAIFAMLIVLRNSAFVVDEAQQALVTQFGRIIGEPLTKAGLHWKIPFVQDVRYFDKRILSWDGDEEQIPTKDKKYIWVDTTARWRITNARKFAESMRNEQQAKAKLDSILDGITRDTISNHNLVEAVRNSNAILEKQRAKENAKNQKKTQNEDTEDQVDDSEFVTLQVDEEITGDIEPIAVGREKLSRQIAKRATKELERFGIVLIDVQLRRIAYEKSVEEKVYNRMISERKRIAEKIRSIGKGEEAKIKGKLNRDLKEIESNAYRTSQEIRGRAEAEAISTYAKSMKEAPDFYKFIRSMEAYRKTLSKKGDFILSTESEFLRYLKDQP